MNYQLLLKNGYKKLFVLAFVQLSYAPFSYAKSVVPVSMSLETQQGTVSIKGRVTDAQGEPVVGASVLVKGTSYGTVTNVNGIYQIENVKVGQTLLFSFIGMTPQTITISSVSSIDVVLKEESTMLTEVVAVGYGVQRKKDITGSVGSVKSENFNSGLSNSPEQLIQGKVAGVNITSSSGAPGSGQRVIVRGQGSLREGTGPLYVVDGFPLGLGGTGSDDTNPYNFLNPEDIESIDVLKDASAAAIYGTRGANGVILITTKSGKSGNMQASVSAKFGVSQMANKMPVFSADEFRKQVKAIGGNLVDRGGNTDWQDVLTHTAISQDHSLTMMGGSSSFNYRASVGYLNQEGILINTGIERYTANVKATQKLLDGKLSIDYGLNSSVEKGENTNSSYLVSSMLSFNPTYKAKNDDGTPVNYADQTNPLIYADLYTNFSQSRKLIANISPSIELLKGLTYKLNFGYENNSREADLQTMPSKSPFYEGSLTQQYMDGYNTMIENYLTYNLKTNNHSLTLLAGQSYQETYERFRSWSISKFSDNGLEPRYNPSYGQLLTLTDNKPSGSADIVKLQSFFGRINYNYLDRYLLTATLRADGSSKFGEDNRYGYFPSFAAGWLLSEEQFLKDNAIISNLKLRAGWGLTGNQEIPTKRTQMSYLTTVSGSLSYPLDNSSNYFAGTTYVRLPNKNLQWEVSTQSNIGLDFAFFKSKLSGTIEYYNKVSNNILLEIPTTPIVAANTTWDNVKDMTITNRGLELALDYRANINKNMRFNIGGTLATVKNKVKNSPYTVITTGSAEGSGLTGATINGLINGYSVGSFYMREFIGIGADGLSQYADDEKLKVVGSALPDLTYSFYLNMGYKGFDLVANFNGVSGNKIYNNTAMNKFYKAQLANSSNTTSKAVEYANESTANAGAVSTRYLEDGSFLRLNNLSLGYSFDTKSLKISDWVKDLRLSVSGQNLFVITEYSGYDPEVNQNRSSGGFQSFGIDLNSYPRARTFSVGLNVTFN